MPTGPGPYGAAVAIVGVAAESVEERLAMAAGLVSAGDAGAVQQAVAVLAELVRDLDDSAAAEQADLRTTLATHVVAISALQSAGAAPTTVARLVGRAVDAVGRYR
jgi:hypothetical protein